MKNKTTTPLSLSGPMPHIFIVGVGRSGTSLLQSMLASHPQLAFPPEINFVRRFLGTQILAKQYQTLGMAGFADWLAQDNWLDRLKVDFTEIVQQSLGADGQLSGALLYSYLMQAYAKQQGKSLCGDKDPRSLEFLPLIHHFYPRAHIVHILRDPRDVLVSKKKAGWSRRAPVLRHIFANGFQFSYGHKMGQKLFKNKYHLIIYEELLRRPESILTGLCDAIGIAYSSKMLNFQQAARKIVTASERAWKKETLGPLIKNNSGKWQHALSEEEIGLTERFCSKAFAVGGYQFSQPLSDITGHHMKQRLICWFLEIFMGIYQQHRNRALQKRMI